MCGIVLRKHPGHAFASCSIKELFFFLVGLNTQQLHCQIPHLLRGLIVSCA